MSASNRCCVLQAIGAMAALALAAGCATTDEARAARESARMQALQTELLARGDADSLAASALFALNGRMDRTGSGGSAAPAAAFGLAARAVAAAPERADLALEQIQFCQEVPSCDSAALEARLLALDPESGVPWMYALLRAETANDAQAVRRARTAMAQAQRMAWYWNETVSRMTAAVTGHAGFGAQEAMVTVIGVEAALVMPLQPVSKACSVQEIQLPEVLGQCRRIATAFRNSDIYIFESYGTSLGIRLWPPDSVERAQIAAERRTVHYWEDVWNHHSALLNSPAAARILGALYAQFPTEQQAYRALYIHFGLQSDPPADWIDPAPGS